MSRKSPKKYKIYKYNYTCNRLPKKNLLKKSSEIDFSSGDILTSKKSRFQRILNRVRGKKKREISPSYFITPWFYWFYFSKTFFKIKYWAFVQNFIHWNLKKKLFTTHFVNSRESFSKIFFRHLFCYSFILSFSQFMTV